MASSSSFSLSNLLQSPPPPFFLQKKSSFLGQTTHLCISSPHNHHHRPSTTNTTNNFCAKFNLFEIMGGRGLCNGEKNLQKELEKKKPLQLVVVSHEEITTTTTTSAEAAAAASSSPSLSVLLEVPENAFGKEMMGLTGGFPGGEEGLRSFIEKNPPPSPSPSPSPPKKSEGSSSSSSSSSSAASLKSSKPPELPILMPGMIAIVKNPKSPYYMYCGIIQRITDGRAGVLFEGGNWDKIIAFKLNELERRDKGPPMVNPKSAILESQIQNQPGLN